MNTKNQTQKQLSRSRAAAKGNSCQLQLQLCAMLLAAAAVAAPAPVAAGKEKPNAAEAPKVINGDPSSRADARPGYTTCTSFSQVMQASDARYPAITRVSDPGSKENPVYTGFWDTYAIHGFQYLFLFHRPSKRFVPLARLQCDRRMDIGDGEYRVDTHSRLSRNGRMVSIDASHEGLGRQMYVIDIGNILDHPPQIKGPAAPASDLNAK